MNKPLILLTGCIDPQNMIYTDLLNKNVRERQYIDAIEFYLCKTELPILFVENSGNDISNHFKVYETNKRIEFLTFNGNDFEKKLGKGYGEMKILEYAIAHSNFIEQTDFIFKITGRYKILNINKYIKRYNSNYNIFDIYINFKNNLSFADSRFFCATKHFFSNFLVNNKYIINDSENIYFEHVLSNAVHEFIINGYSYSGLKHYPRISGVYATKGIKYNSNWFSWYPKEILSLLLYRIQKFNFINF